MNTGASEIPVSVVLVTYNSEAVVGEAIRSIDPRAEIIVVDNDSSDGTVALLRDLGVQVVTSDVNVGFGRACNIGAKASKREFVFFLNPDARLQPGAMDRLVQSAASRPECAAFNPRILGSDGTQSRRRMSRLLPLELNDTLRAPLTGDQDVEMLSGAALFCRRHDFEMVGGFDEKIFLYCEDDDLAVRFRKAGRRLGYVHGAVVKHLEGASTIASPALAEFKSYHYMKSNRYAMRKHGIVFRQNYQLLQCSLKYILGSLTFDRQMQQKYRGYLKALTEQDEPPCP